MPETYIPGGGGPQTYNESMTEVISAVDAMVSMIIAPNAVAEACNPGDSLTYGNVIAQYQSEPVTAGDSLVSVYIAVNLYSESITLADPGNSGSTYRNPTSEAITTGDSLTSTSTFTNPWSEAITLVDNPVTAATYRHTQSEPVTLLDAMVDAWIRGGGRVYDETILEQLNLGAGTRRPRPCTIP
jgi:hypothetical protein